MQGRHRAQAAWHLQGCELNATVGTPLQSRFVWQQPSWLTWVSAISGLGHRYLGEDWQFLCFIFAWPVKNVHVSLTPCTLCKAALRLSPDLSHLWLCQRLVAEFSANSSRIMWSYLMQTHIMWAIESRRDTCSHPKNNLFLLAQW